MIEEKVKAAIRDIKDFPKKGIVFKDITPILSDPALTTEITDALAENYAKLNIDAVMGIESRGFLWGILLAQKLNVPFIPVRKKGKLPYKTVSHKYDLEYGSAEIEVHEDAIEAGSSILIHDDLLATGGTAAAAANIVKKQNAEIAAFSFLVVLDFLKGEKKLLKFSDRIEGIVHY
ncbi:MAG: adenine phosphoribosyltransferase [Flavobacteriales bacterium]|nr:adenine phosphoribosyltransferase [Flavobacteriales bacterium]|tara:strand:- start:49426 stop:49953 length:528 start_codon:yes stop_codon:yes gene_type:complete